MPEPAPRRLPLRADARRNLDRILTAAAEVFAERGMDASVDEVAQRAGVGHATVYRRFPTKEDLVVAIIERRMREFLSVAEEAMDAPDPTSGLQRAMEYACDRKSADRGFFEAVGAQLLRSPRLEDLRGEVHDALGRLLRRAQDAGAVRVDLEPADILFLVSAAAHATPVDVGPPDLWRRYVAVVLDGMRADHDTPLHPRAPTRAEVTRGCAQTNENQDTDRSLTT